MPSYYVIVDELGNERLCVDQKTAKLPENEQETMSVCQMSSELDPRHMVPKHSACQ